MKLPLLRIPIARRAAAPANTRSLAASINATLSRAFRDAGLAPQVGSRISATLDEAFAAAGLRDDARARTVARTYDGTAMPAANDDLEARATALDDPPQRAAALADREADAGCAGRFAAGTFTNHAGTRGYKVYVPARLPAPRDRMLVVMLHGCTQSPDDFAAGTRMNAIAEREGLIVLYPAQDVAANGSRCWNWFRPQDQERERGEPAVIAGMAREIAQAQGVERGQVFVAGLSAGAAMAVTLGATHPDLFGAVGAHSGLAHGAAHDVPSAFAAMHGRGRAQAGATPREDLPMPTIVFHGMADATVNPQNGAAIVERLVSRSATHALRTTTHAGRTPRGGAYQRVVYEDEASRPVIEHWMLDGVGHAWSGGSSAGSYTHPDGPDASSEMIRFFRAQAVART